MANAVEIFISCAPKDIDLLNELETHLKPLARTLPINIWHPYALTAGEHAEEKIYEHLNAAHIILLLITANFVASEQNYEEDLPNAMERYENEGTYVIPVLLRTIAWKDEPFGKLVPLPKNGRFVIGGGWTDKDTAYYTINTELKEVIRKLMEKLQLQPITPIKNTKSVSQREPIDSSASSSKALPTTSTFSNGHALLIGVGGSGIEVTVKDATAVRDVLVDPARAAYPAQQVQLLTGAQATREQLLNAFDALAARVDANPDATVLIYFSGHGLAIEQTGQQSAAYYLVPHGYDPRRRDETAISGQEFTRRLEAIRARKLVVLLDCCHAGGISTAKGPGETVKSINLPLDVMKVLNTGSGRVVIASSTANEESWTGDPYSIFTACLLESLEGKGTQAQDGFARLLDVLAYLFNTVPERAAKSQHPIFQANDLSDNFPLCYYAGGSKALPGAIPPVAATASNPLTAGKRTRLQERLNQLLEERKLVSRMEKETSRQWLLEYNPSLKIQWELQAQGHQNNLIRLESEIDQLENQLL